MPTPDAQLQPQDLERLFSAERLSTYIEHCGGDFAAAVEMYRWNSAITAAFWLDSGHQQGTTSRRACGAGQSGVARPAGRRSG
jgi:hypothetical protein